MLINERSALLSMEHCGDTAELPDGVVRRFDAASAVARSAAAARGARLKLTRVPTDYLCPVCGHRMPEPPWEGGIGSHEICPCCGIQFGLHDSRPDLRAQIHAERRERWIADGGTWRHGSPPDDWDPRAQLDALPGQRRGSDGAP